jgi:hypothetical protein
LWAILESDYADPANLSESRQIPHRPSQVVDGRCRAISAANRYPDATLNEISNNVADRIVRECCRDLSAAPNRTVSHQGTRASDREIGLRSTLARLAHSPKGLPVPLANRKLADDEPVASAGWQAERGPLSARQWTRSRTRNGTGSGKTTLAVLRSLYLADPRTDHAGRVLLVTFNKCLVSYLRSLAGGFPGSVDVRNYHHFARGYVSSRGHRRFLSRPRD